MARDCSDEEAMQLLPRPMANCALAQEDYGPITCVQLQ